MVFDLYFWLMHREIYNVVGVMSGTSLDGIDLAHVQLSKTDNKWSFELLECETVSYSPDWKALLSQLVARTPDELADINRRYTELLAKIISGFISKHQLKIDAVCSHGHTALHQPTNGFTLQIGNLPELATLTNQLVVCDFRTQDVELGGQGAPLVPIGDRHLFGDFDYCLNLGGFSNISFESAGKRIAFDISPVNTVLNHLTEKLGFDYDDRGKIAASAEVDAELLLELNALAYYKLPFPKSLGFEFVAQTILPLIENFDSGIEDKLCTFTEHIALQTALAMPSLSGKMLVTGGGAYNDYLISRLEHYLPNIAVAVPDAKILEYKEALIFAFLGVLKLRGENNVLSSVTGAPSDHSSGVIFSND